MKSKFGKLDKKDFLRGMGMAFGTALLVSVGYSLQGGITSLTLPMAKSIVFSGLFSGVGAAIIYIGKNLFTNSSDNFGRKERGRYEI